MEKTTARSALFKTVLTALFAAICYVALFFMIPVPSPVGNPFIHFGNLFVILAAVLFSGTVGGIAGSLGMGLFDLTHGYEIYAPKTFILKLGIGLVAGFVASKGRKAGAKSPLVWLIVSGALMTVLGAALAVSARQWGSVITVSAMKLGDKPLELTISPVLYIFSLILGIGLLVFSAFARKLSVKLQYVVIAAVCGILFNLAGEFLLGTLYPMILQGSAFVPALIASAVSLPATLINGVFSIVGAVVLYIPLEKAAGASGFLSKV